MAVTWRAFEADGALSLSERKEEPAAVLDGDFLRFRVPVNAREWRVVDDGGIGRLEEVAVTSAWGPVDLTRRGACWDRPVVACLIGASAEGDLDAVFKCECRADREWDSCVAGGRATLVPTPNTGVASHVDADHRRGQRDGWDGGIDVLDLIQQAGAVWSFAEEVGVVADLDPLVGRKAEVGVGTEGVNDDGAAGNTGDCADQASRSRVTT